MSWVNRLKESYEDLKAKGTSRERGIESNEYGVRLGTERAYKETRELEANRARIEDAKDRARHEVTMKYAKVKTERKAALREASRIPKKGGKPVGNMPRFNAPLFEYSGSVSSGVGFGKTKKKNRREGGMFGGSSLFD